MIYLSILIPTLTRRKFYFETLRKELLRQKTDEVEILIYSDNREKTTGFKRNELIERAKGLFVVFIDDDDKIAPNYIELVLNAIKNNPDIDAVGIRGLYSEDGKPPVPFETSLAHNWEFRNGWYLRTINHISPIKREHANKVKFPDKVHGEDYEYTMELKKKRILKTQVIIEQNIYFYNFISNKKF